MRIAQVSTLVSRVARDATSSIEALVWLLGRELSRLGHEVTLFAAGDSEHNGKLVATFPHPMGTEGGPSDWHLGEWINICDAIELAADFDIIHSHGYLWGMPVQRFSACPIVNTLHISPGPDTIALWSRYPQSYVTALSRYQWSIAPQLHPLAVVYHGVDPSLFPYSDAPGDYLCYLGRFTAGKGITEAIAMARSLGIRLLIAGPENAYFQQHVKPLVDGRSVEYVGMVKGRERAEFLGGSRALLYPLRVHEPFGLVMVEAMMCGTPVAAIRVGAVPEVVEDGLTGYSAESLACMQDLVPATCGLNRRQVRERSLERFSAARMAREYVQVYEDAVQRYGDRV